MIELLIFVAVLCLIYWLVVSATGSVLVAILVVLILLLAGVGPGRTWYGGWRGRRGPP